ncbi:MAG TPA: MqnA/MqnD/SBP family protein [Phycisphaerales bacterium]|nr:MqnA/MqnD/SBP family protein [Phycisphaerales bacterium]
MISVTLAHSPDPDDVFMWWPITGMIEPPADPRAVEPARVISPPVLDTGDIRFVPIAADISVLNKRAIERGDLDITAMSMNCYARVASKYQLTSFGSSMGYGYGPRLDARAARRLASPVCYREELDAAEPPGEHLPAGSVCAIPGRETTAFLVLSMMLGTAGAGVRFVEMPFDRILETVAQGSDGITHGLLIHQSQLTYEQAGVELVADVGRWWLEHTGLPLPLGGNAIRRDLRARFGDETRRRIVNLLHASIGHALADRERSVGYCMRFAPEITRAQAEKYIRMYVNDLTVDAGENGRMAIERLLGEGHALGLCPNGRPIDLASPDESPG